MENIPRTSPGSKDGNTIRMGINLRKKKKRQNFCEETSIVPNNDKNEVDFFLSFPALFGLKKEICG